MNNTKLDTAQKFKIKTKRTSTTKKSFHSTFNKPFKIGLKVGFKILTSNLR